jgi:uncharacterized protein (DUF1697 family)
MARMIILLRGINIGPRNRIAMPALREALADAGMPGARTYVQSGNVVLDSELDPDALRAETERLIAERFDLQIAVVVRTRDELAEVIARDPLGDEATEPKRYQVSFLSDELDQAVVEKLRSRASETERLVAIGRELYAWHPDGVGRSKLWASVAAKGLGVTATARNWLTVNALLEMADAD